MRISTRTFSTRSAFAQLLLIGAVVLAAIVLLVAALLLTFQTQKPKAEKPKPQEKTEPEKESATEKQMDLPKANPPADRRQSAPASPTQPASKTETEKKGSGPAETNSRDDVGSRSSKSKPNKASEVKSGNQGGGHSLAKVSQLHDKAKKLEEAGRTKEAYEAACDAYSTLKTSGASAGASEKAKKDVLETIVRLESRIDQTTDRERLKHDSTRPLLEN